MSLKAIEMQVALPRTMDAGKMQEQLQQRGQTLNDVAAERTLKEEEQKRTTVIKQEQKSNVKLSQEERGNKKNSDEHKSKEKEKSRNEIEKKEKHPYKGSRIDFSG